MKKYPVKLSYISKSAIWGGNTLKNKWNKVGNGDNIAETWELTVREKEMSKITNGQACRMTLAEYIRACGFDSVSPTYGDGDRFPLLVKFIDAADRLSVQVHPDDLYASEAENDSGKTEMWYIVDACDGAEIIYGLADGLNAEGFKAAVDRGELDSAMKKIKVKKGDCFFIPAGMLHAIGEGILIAEIQQNSDLTYRVYDYDRVGKDGKKRELHTDKAFCVVRPYTEAEVDAIRFSRGREEGCLANCDYFKVSRICVNGERELSVGESFTSLLCVDGDGYIEHDGEKYEITKGDSYFCPAGMGCFNIVGELTLIASEI